VKNIFLKKFIFGACYFAIFSLPFLILAQFYCDDKLLILTKDIINYFNISRLQFMYDSFYSMLASERLYLLYAFHYLIFFVNDNRLVYYIIKYIFNLLSIIIVAKYIYNLTKNHSNYIVYFFLVISLFISTVGVDPIVSMGISVQLSVIFIFATLIFFDLYQKNNKRKYYFLSQIFCFLSYSYYEMGYCIIPLIIILNNRHRIDKYNVQGGFINYFKTTIKSCYYDLKSYLIVFIIWISLYFFVKIHFENGYDGVAFGNRFKDFILTWIAQIIASFPLGSFNQKLISYKIELWQIPSLLLLFLMAYFPLKNNLAKINLKNYYREIILIGLSLILFPSLIVSMTSKYQIWTLNTLIKEKYFYAFLQVFIQYFGVALLMLSFIAKTIQNSELYASKIRKKILINFYAIAISLLITIVAYLNYNCIIVKNVTEDLNASGLLSRAFKSGLANTLISSKKTTNLNQNFFIKNLSDIYKEKSGSYYSPEEFKENYKVLINFAFFTTSFNFFQYTQQLVLPLFLNFTPYHKVIFNDKKIFYLDYGKPNYDIDFKKFDLKKNLEGFIVFGKLISINNQTIDENKFNIFELSNPRIYIDKEYLFRLPQIIENLNKRFGEIVINSNEIDALRNKILNSQKGIIIDLPAKNYQVIF
jgi:hypothetical protein